MAIVPVVEVCPGCARREIDTPSGLCAPCVVHRRAELYAERGRDAVHLRSISWSERSTRPDAEHVRLRQQQHRLTQAVRPETPAPAGTDPWELGAEAVRALGRVRSGLPRTSHKLDDLERAVEIVRQLAWGPGD